LTASQENVRLAAGDASRRTFSATSDVPAPPTLPRCPRRNARGNNVLDAGTETLAEFVEEWWLV
jgi:hypothetical protein